MAERSFEIRLVLLEAIRDTQEPWVRLELLGNGALVKACPVTPACPGRCSLVQEAIFMMGA